MPPRRRSLDHRRSVWSLLALASCSWGCPQLLSDEFKALGNPPDRDDPGSPHIDGGSDGATAGSAGDSGSEPPPDPLNAGGTGGAVGTGGGGGAPSSVPGPPSVVSVTPSNAASGVAADAVVTVTFSEPMNTGAVEAAYSSSDLPVGSVSFSWANGDTVLQITPNQPLSLATGSDPTTTVARSYAFDIGAGAVDLDADALPAFSSSFSTLRAITQTSSAVQDRTLTGNFRSDDVYGNNSCQQLDSETTCIGDSSNGDSTYRGFVTFDLSGLPATIEAISTARLSMTIDSIRYSPFPDLGSLVVERVSFDSISLAAFDSAALGPAVDITSSASAGAQLGADVLAAVRDDLPARARSQFRFRFSTATDADGIGDLIEILWTTEQLAITYLIP